MPKFIIHERIMCEVTFVKVIEADNIDAAIEADDDGAPSVLLGVHIGDGECCEREPFPATIEHLPHGPFYSEPGTRDEAYAGAIALLNAEMAAAPTT
jgi:hypothetical protein